MVEQNIGCKQGKTIEGSMQEKSGNKQVINRYDDGDPFVLLLRAIRAGGFGPDKPLLGTPPEAKTYDHNPTPDV